LVAENDGGGGMTVLFEIGENNGVVFLVFTTGTPPPIELNGAPINRRRGRYNVPS
jgi:hypothetical protein